jgi:hypothetical protein
VRKRRARSTTRASRRGGQRKARARSASSRTACRLHSPQKAPVPGHPTVRTGPDRASGKDFMPGFPCAHRRVISRRPLLRASESIRSAAARSGLFEPCFRIAIREVGVRGADGAIAPRNGRETLGPSRFALALPRQIRQCGDFVSRRTWCRDAPLPQREGEGSAGRSRRRGHRAQGAPRHAFGQGTGRRVRCGGTIFAGAAITTLPARAHGRGDARRRSWS